MPTLPELFQMPFPAKYALLDTVRLVVDAFANKVFPSAVSVPEKYPLPITDSFSAGVVVPMPTLPFLSIRRRSVLASTFVPPPPFGEVKR